MDSGWETFYLYYYTITLGEQKQARGREASALPSENDCEELNVKRMLER
jgi:hypothetical protein